MESVFCGITYPDGMGHRTMATSVFDEWIATGTNVVVGGSLRFQPHVARLLILAQRNKSAVAKVTILGPFDKFEPPY